MTLSVRRSVAVAAIAAVIVSVIAVPAALAADHPVDIAGFAFSPTSITIRMGDSVTWANADAQSHTATADDGSFDTGTVTTSTPKSVTFSTAGTVAYHCRIHPAMTGTIVVEAATGTAPTTDAPLRPAAADAGSFGLALIALVGVASAVVIGMWLARRRT